MAKNNLSNSWSTGSSSLFNQGDIPNFTPLETTTYQLNSGDGRNNNASKPSYSSISDSYNRMGFGRIGSLGGRMGELEKASLRLGETASARILKEQEEEGRLQQILARQQFGYQSKLQAQRAAQEQEFARMNKGQ